MLDVGYLQFRPRFGRVAANLKQVLSVLDGVRADLVVLPELAFTGYHLRDRAEATRCNDPLRDRRPDYYGVLSTATPGLDLSGRPQLGS